MHVKVFGNEGGRDVLLLHGGGVGGWMWTPLRDRLSRGIRYIVPDLPGHDRSADEEYVSHEQTVAELMAILETSRARRVTVIGFSLGAQLAITLASRHPDLVDRVVVISAQTVPMRLPEPTLALVRSASGLAKRTWFASLQAKALFIPDELLDDYLRTSASISKSTLMATVEQNIRFTTPGGWEGFPGRALILAGADEKSLMRDSAMSLNAALPTSTVEIVGGAGHGLPLQRPEWLAGRLAEWFAADHD